MARRGRGAGTVTQRHDHPSCPPAEVVEYTDAHGELKTKKVHPDHRCRGTWMAQLPIGKAAGKRVRLTAYAPTQKKAEAALDDLKKKAPRRGAASSWTVAQWMDHWLEDIADVREGTYHTYESKIRTYINPLIGHHKLNSLQPQHIRAMYKRLREECPDPVYVEGAAGDEVVPVCHHSPHHKRSESTVRQTHAILRRALKMALWEENVDRNVAEFVKPPSVKTEDRDALSIEQARKVLETAKGDTYETRWFIALYLGMRQGEVLGLHWYNVDLHEGVIYIRETLQRRHKNHGGGYFFDGPKSNESTRDIPVPKAILSRLKVMWAVELAAADGDEDVAHARLVWNNNGMKLDPSADSKRWARLLKKAGVPHTPLHAARNTTASLLLADLGLPAAIAKEILGHSTIVLTHDVYTKTDLALRRKSLESLGDFLEGEIAAEEAVRPVLKELPAGEEVADESAVREGDLDVVDDD